MVWVSLGLIILAIGSLWLSKRILKARGFPKGRVLYADMGILQKVNKSFFDDKVLLSGKPDYIIKQNRKIIPIEVKSTHIKEQPYDSHILQLAAYCFLIERTYSQRPPYGILRYPNRTITIFYTPQLERQLLSVIKKMRDKLVDINISRSHTSYNKCRRCGFNHICDQKLQ